MEKRGKEISRIWTVAVAVAVAVGMEICSLEKKGQKGGIMNKCKSVQFLSSVSLFLPIL